MSGAKPRILVGILDLDLSRYLMNIDFERFTHVPRMCRLGICQ